MAVDHGCFLHFCQSLHQQVPLFGLTSSYVQNENVRSSCRSTMALASLPVKLIGQAVQLLEDESFWKMTSSLQILQISMVNVNISKILKRIST
ncbi:unnamed protein product [Adineta ricciae]|uniref:Uncharacterized protein n=1 Tax=Adineta ricciae TaxID=249248 RepID=A0A814MIJ4_ADIRI|nr:unnamed protein product [Adineta ricciae]CAF1635722.1 unnamed protein product [Adineta ricciae]